MWNLWITQLVLQLCTTNPISKSNLSGIPHGHTPFTDVTNPKHIDAFRTEKAPRTKRFVDSLENINVLYICCDSGESRSAAIAAALLRHWKWNDMAIWRSVRFRPNLLVYRLQCRSFGCSISKLHVFVLFQCNTRTLKRQIQQYRWSFLSPEGLHMLSSEKENSSPLNINAYVLESSQPRYRYKRFLFHGQDTMMHAICASPIFIFVKRIYMTTKFLHN